MKSQRFPTLLDQIEIKDSVITIPHMLGERLLQISSPFLPFAVVEWNP
jgi:hypothetical protein